MSRIIRWERVFIRQGSRTTLGSRIARRSGRVNSTASGGEYAAVVCGRRPGGGRGISSS